MVLVCLLIYTFQASDPDSRPPPVSFSPPKAPPVSAPEVPMFTLAIPQSEPTTDKNNSASRKLLVMIADDNPCATPFWIAIASITSPEYFNKYNTGAKVSCCTISNVFSASAIAGLTEHP